MTRNPRLRCERRIIGESCSLPFCSLIVNAGLVLRLSLPASSVIDGSTARELGTRFITRLFRLDSGLASEYSQRCEHDRTLGIAGLTRL